MARPLIYRRTVDPSPSGRRRTAVRDPSLTGTAGISPARVPRCAAMPIRTVIFDFYGTLAHAAHPTPTLTELLALLGVDVTPEVTERWHIGRMDGILHEEASVSREAYEAWEESRWSGMLADCGVEGDLAANLMNAIRVQVRGFHVAPYPETAPVLDELRARGLRIGVCSNWHWDLDPYLEQAGVHDRIDAAITSARVGARKHHPLIYRRTLETMDVDPSEALFVGDSWEPDVTGPLGSGFAGAVHIARGDVEHPELPAGAVRASDLHGVLTAI